MSVNQLPTKPKSITEDKRRYLQLLEGALGAQSVPSVPRTDEQKEHDKKMDDAFVAAETFMKKVDDGVRDVVRPAFKRFQIWDDVHDLVRKEVPDAAAQLDVLIRALETVQSFQQDDNRQPESIRTAIERAHRAPTPAQNKIYLKLQHYQPAGDRILGDVPLDFQPPDAAIARLERRKAALGKTPEQRQQDIEGVVGAPQVQEQALQALNTLKSKVEAKSMVGFARFDPSDPQLADALTPQELNDIQAAIAKAMANAEKIRDMGGTPEQMESAFGGIPKQWWPPRFVMELQAWRRVHRLVQAEEVAREALLSKHGGKGTSALREAGKALWVSLQFAAKQAQFAFTVSNDVQSAHDAIHDVDPTAPSNAGEAFINVIKATHSDVLQTVSDVADGYDAMTSSDPEELLQQKKTVHNKLDSAASTLGKIGSGTKTVFDTGDTIWNNTIKAVDDERRFSEALIGSSSGGSFAPGLGLALALLNLANTIRKLVEERAWRKEAKGLANEEYLRRRQDGQSWDNFIRGGNLARAFNQEVDRRDQNIGETKFELVLASMDVAAASFGVASGTGFADAASAIISVTKAGIEVVGKIVIANIDFNNLDAARQTLKKARAGDMVSQQLIFRQSAYYAKMFIALLAKDGDKLAVKFLVDRGYSESDLKREDVSIAILRDALVNLAGDSNAHDPSAATTRAGHLAQSAGLGQVTQAAGSISESIAAPGRTKPYNDAWKHSDPLLVSEAWWTRNKASAIDAGLLDTSTGIGSALGAVQSAAAALNPPTMACEHVLGVLKYTDVLVKGGEEREAKVLLAIRKAAQKAYKTVLKFAPTTNPPPTDGQPGRPFLHGGMADTRDALLKALGTIEDSARAALGERRLLNLSWSPTVPENVLNASSWKALHGEARTHLGIEASDGGVEAALKTLGKAIDKEATQASLFSSSRGNLTSYYWDVDNVGPADRAGARKRLAAALTEHENCAKGLRVDRIALLEAASSVVKLINSAPSEWAAHDDWWEYVGSIKEAARHAHQRVDGEMSPETWYVADGNPTKQPTALNISASDLFSAKTWSSVHQRAVNAGLIGEDDKGVRVTKALEATAEALSGLEKAKSDQEKTSVIRKKRTAARESLPPLADAVEAFVQAEKATLPADYTKYCSKIVNAAGEKARSLLDEQNGASPISFICTGLASGQHNWPDFYASAVVVAAVKAHVDASALSKHLGKFGDHFKKMNAHVGANENKKARKEVDSVLKYAGKVAEDAGNLSKLTQEGYAEHPAVSAAVQTLLDSAAKVSTLQAVVDVLNGPASITNGLIKPSTAKLTKGSWKAFKLKATNLGIIPDADTGMTPALKEYDSATADFNRSPHLRAKFDARVQSLATLKEVIETKLRPNTESTKFAADDAKKWVANVERAVDLAIRDSRIDHDKSVGEKLDTINASALHTAPESWSALHKVAMDAGLAEKSDHGVGDRLKAWTKTPDESKDNIKVPGERRKARLDRKQADDALLQAAEAYKAAYCGGGGPATRAKLATHLDAMISNVKRRLDGVKKKLDAPDVKATAPSELSASQWTAFLTDAVKVGAVSGAIPEAKALTAALTTYESKRGAFDAENPKHDGIRNHQEVLKLAMDVLAGAEQVGTATSSLLGRTEDGFGTHPQVKVALEAVLGFAEAVASEAVVTDAAAGKVSTTRDKQLEHYAALSGADRLDTGKWVAFKKAAVQNGVLRGEATGVTAGLTALNKALKNHTNNRVDIELVVKVEAAVEALVGKLAGVRPGGGFKSVHAGTYFDNIEAAAKTSLSEARTGQEAAAKRVLLDLERARGQ